MNVYNEADYIGYAIESVIRDLDRLIIIEGKFAESSGPVLSDDGTMEVLKDKYLKFYSHRILPLCGENLPQLQQRDMVFGHLDRPCWLWIVDGDEAYTKENIAKVKEAIQTTKAESLRINSYVFVNDFRHCVYIKMPRLFHIYPGVDYKFIEPNTIAKNGIRLSEEERPDIFFHHYSYCKSPERFLQKREERIRQTGSFKWNITPEGRIYAPNVNIRVFDGEHPEVMRQHWRYSHV